MANREVNDKLFQTTLKALIHKFGDGYQKFGLAEPNPKAIPTGHDDLDCLLTKGANGIYLGGIVELMGSESSGKTSIALRTVGNAQKLGHRCCWFDAEASFDEELARLNGVDPTTLVLPDLIATKEMVSKDGLTFFNSGQLLEMIYQTIIGNIFGLVVLDSVAGLMPQRVLDSNFDPNSSGVAELARNMSMILPKIAQACKKTETTLICVNQLRDQPGAYISNPYHTPGGRALKFFAHQRISIERIRGKNGDVTINEEGQDRRIGHWARVAVVKNRKAPPPPRDMTLEIPIYYEPYFPDDARKVYDLARKLQTITMRNGILTFKNNNETVFQIQGESNVLAHIRENNLISMIAEACVVDAEGDRNLNRKSPIKVPQHIVDLAQQNTTNVVAVAKTASKKKRRSTPALDLDSNEV